MNKTIPDSIYKEYLPENNIFNHVSNRNGFIHKWDSPLDANGKVVDGVKLPTEAEKFITEVTQASTILDNSRVIPIKGLEYDLNYMDVDVDWQDMRATTGGQITNVSQVAGATPSFKRRNLVLHPVIAYSRTPWVTVQENVEGDQFLSTYRQLIAEKLGYKLSLISVYGKYTASPATRSAMYTMDGLLKKLQDTKDNTTERTTGRDPQGIYCGYGSTGTTISPIDFSVASGTGDAADQLNNMIAQYGLQKGKKQNAAFYVSTQVESKLSQLAGKRQTAGGDSIYFEGGILKVWGRPVIIADELDDYTNGFNEHIIFGDLNSFAMGMGKDYIETQADFNIRDQMYDEVTRARVDFQVVNDKDILAAEVTGLLGTPSSGSGSGSGTTTP